jgi:hypothetical protein
LFLSAQSAAAQSSGEVRLPAVTGEAENVGPPIIQSVTYRLNSPGPGGFDWRLTIDIHFIAPQGNASSVQSKIIEKTPFSSWSSSEPINNSADSQKSGTYVSWTASCNKTVGPKGHVASETYILDANGNHSNSVRFTSHCIGEPFPYFNQQVEVSPTKYVDVTIPHTGTEDALRSYIEGWKKGAPPYDILSPSVAAETQANSAAIKKRMDAWGELKSITFKASDPRGLDTYAVVFEHGESVWSITQLTADGKMSGLSIGPSTANTAPLATHDEQSSPVPAQ